jgi:ppGpp synthetase/RelA/SpoT-type nucleotidyltranferase
MADAQLEYSLSKVKNAGKILRDHEPGSKDFGDALEVFANWRSCHSVPLNQFHDSLQEYVLAESPLTTVVHRPKRIEAVIKKLKRDSNAQLSTMQDIAGCRAIVNSIDDVDPFVEACKQMWSKHTLHKEYPYIQQPNPKTGYRGIHLVYKYQSNNRSFDGRLIEIQIRTREQHAWAAAVETVDTIQRQSLKSGEGNQQWQRFFCLMSSAIAKRESSPIVPNTPLDSQELKNELRHYAETLQVVAHLEAYGAIARVIERHHEELIDYAKSAGQLWLFLVELDLVLKQTLISAYSEPEVQQAYLDVAEAERAGKNVVLAGASDFQQLKEAYPNWFIDTEKFLRILRTALHTGIGF